MPQISLDEITAKRAFSMHDGVVYRAAKMPKSFNEEGRSAGFIMTDETKDSYGDIVIAKGGDLTRFESNPIALLNHDKNRVIGTWADVKRVAKRIEGVVTLAEPGTSEDVDKAFNLMRQGILRAASIGFLPLEWEIDRDEDGNWMGIKWTKWEMTECSVVSVPANPMALAKSIKQGNTLALDLLEEVLDTYTKTAAGLIVPRSELEEAHREATGNPLKVNVDISAMDGFAQFKSLVERAEAAAKALGGDDEPAATDEDEINLITKDVEDALEKAMEEFTVSSEELPEKHKGFVARLMERVRGVFREEEPEPPVIIEGSLERARALRERMKQIADKEAA